MNFSGTSSQKLCYELRKIFNSQATSLNEILRRPVSALTTWNLSEKTGRRERSRINYEPPEWKFKLPRNKREFLLLCCLSWYLDEDISVLLRLELENQKTKFGPYYEQKIALLLESEPKMIIYILESNVLGRNPNEVFGNILAKKVRIEEILIFNATRRKDSNFWNFKDIKLTFISNPVKKPQFHRGYRDKGSLNLGSEWRKEERKDFTTTELQNRIEENREAVADATAFWSGFIE